MPRILVRNCQHRGGSIIRSVSTFPSEPGNDGFKLASFATLQSIANVYSIARTCIQRRKDEIAGLDWDIVPTHEASKAYQGDHAAMRDFGERRAEAVKFFKRPDPNYFGFDGFLKALLEQVFVYDALSVLMRPRWGKGLKRGLLGSDLDCFELVDGATIRPLLEPAWWGAPAARAGVAAVPEGCAPQRLHDHVE